MISVQDKNVDNINVWQYFMVNILVCLGQNDFGNQIFPGTSGC
jgi:hypothetical protein